jgi:hypothetical protein
LEANVPSIDIRVDGDGQFPELEGRHVHHVQDFVVTALTGGMASGMPSVAIIIPLPDGSVVFAESSLRLLLTAADALKAKYGDPR